MSPSVPLTLRQHYGLFFSAYCWQLLVTHTYDLDRLHCGPRGPHPEKATKDFLRWVLACNELLHGPRCHRRGIPGLQFVFALELQRRGVVHSHAVMADPAIDLTPYSAASIRSEMRQLWYRDHGLSRVEVPRSREATTEYVCKYVTKDGEFTISQQIDQVERREPGALLARSAEARARASAR